MQHISLFILWTTGPCSLFRPSSTRSWWLSATGYVADFEPPPGRGGRQSIKVSLLIVGRLYFTDIGRQWLQGLPRHSAGVDNPYSHCQVTRSRATVGPLFPIFFIPWLCNRLTGPKETYPNQAKKKKNKRVTKTYLSLFIRPITEIFSRPFSLSPPKYNPLRSEVMRTMNVGTHYDKYNRTALSVYRALFSVPSQGCTYIFHALVNSCMK